MVSCVRPPPTRATSGLLRASLLTLYSVSELPSTQTAITIENIPSSAYYSIRVTAANSSNFQATSKVLRVKTQESNADSTAHLSGDDQIPALPRVVAYKGVLDQLSLNAAPPPMTRESSSGHVTTRRASHRRSSSGPNNEKQRRRVSGVETQGESIQELTARLDALRRELQEAERQDLEEEEEYEAKKNALLEEKESLRIQLKEKEEGSRKIKGSVTNLERASAAAQSKKNTQERLLQQKKQEREKMREDMARWDAEIAENDIECARLRIEIAEYKEYVAAQVEEIHKEQIPDLEAIKELEQKVKDQRREIDELEEYKNNLEMTPIDDLGASQSESGVDEDLESSRQYNAAKERLDRATKDSQQALLMLQRTQWKYDMLQRRHNNNYYANPTPQAENLPSPNDVAPPLSHAGPARNSSGATPPSFPAYVPVSRFQANAPFEPPRTSSPFFTSRSLTATSAGRAYDGIPAADIDSLTGGALASPGASGLLPSDLLGDDQEEEDIIASKFPAFVMCRTHRPTDPLTDPAKFLPGLGALPGTDIADDASQMQRGPASPTSIDSGRRSMLAASPHMSNPNLSMGEAPTDVSDRVSLSGRSLTDSKRPVRSRLLGDIFGGRSRGKSTSADSPGLGSLRPSESQSLPRAADWSDPSALRPPSRKGNSMLSSFGIGRRGTQPQSRQEHSSDVPISGPMDGRSFGWNDHGSSNTNLAAPWGRTNLSENFGSRPASVYSDNLPRPGEESASFGWSAPDAIGRSNSSRTGSQLAHNPWAVHPSRRTSLAAGPADSTMQLSGSSISEEEEYDEDAEARSPPQAPIGTRPKRMKESQLNPAAGTFTTMFKKDRADREATKAKRKGKGKAPPLTLTSTNSTDDAARRTSKDGRDTAPSIDSSYASTAEDGASTHTAESVPSTPGPSSARSESFMRKLTRKSSSTGKFNLSLSSSREGKTGSFFRRTAAADRPDELADEEVSTSAAGSPAAGAVDKDAREKRSSAFSLAGFKKRRGKEQSTPSISETSVSNASVDEEGEERASFDVPS